MVSWEKLRLLMLPLGKINNALSSEGVIYEIGSGTGSLAAYLAHGFPDRTVVGIDINKYKIQRAQKQFNLPQLSFKVTDALTFKYQKCDAIIFSDFLHHLPYDKQEKMLAIISKILNKNGILVVKEINKSDALRRWLSRVWDFLLYPSDKIAYRTRNDWKVLLEKFGFRVQVSDEVLWFPGSTYLFICKKI